MNKVKTSFFCQSCGTQHAKWQGQCNSCKEWNTLSEEVIKKSTKKVWKSFQKIDEVIKPLKIDQINIKQEQLSSFSRQSSKRRILRAKCQYTWSNVF